MIRNNFKKQVQKEQSFYDFFTESKYGKYHYLLGHFITGFRSENEWKNELLPYFESIQNGTGIINDWNSFPWKGTICFRFGYIMIIDESIHQTGRKFPGLIDENGNQILNEEYEWLLDIEFIKKNYTEFVIISIDDFVLLCKKWIEILISETQA